MKHLKSFEILSGDEMTIKDILNISSDEGYESRIERVPRRTEHNNIIWSNVIWLFDPIGDDREKALEVFKDVINRLQHTIAIEKYSLLAQHIRDQSNRDRDFPYIIVGGAFIGLDELIERMRDTSSQGVRLYFN